MDQNQALNNQVLDQATDNDLQKAIDDITNNTNIDPVFSDPVAAPSSVPEGDTGELGEPVGPFPEPKVEPIAPAPEPVIPTEPTQVSELAPPPTPEPAPMPAPEIAPAPEPEPAPTPTIEKPPVDLTPQTLSTNEVKKAALRDLIPLLDKVNMDGSQKFSIYRNIFEDLKDYTILEPAYHAAREILDETERANALLYLVDAIDKM